MDRILLIILILILISHLTNNENLFISFLTNNENLENNFTLYSISNSKNSNGEDKFLQLNEEFTVGIQNMGDNNIKFKYIYIKGPIGKYISVKAKVYNRKGKLVIKKNTLIKLNKSPDKLLNIFGYNNAIVNDLSQSVYYSIKFLSDSEYQKESNQENSRLVKLNLFNKCITNSKGKGWSNNKIISECSNITGYLL